MQSLICTEPYNLTLCEVEEAVVPEGWVPLDILRVGICGTDYHIYSGTQPFLSYPRVMGHEISARVSLSYTGPDFAPGELVVVIPYIACNACGACSVNRPNCCENISVVGVHADGAMAERFAMPASNLVASRDITPEQAALVEFLAIGRHAVVRSGLSKGEKSLVVGGGPIGLATALFARLAGNNALRYVAHAGTYTLVSIVQGDLQFADPEFHKRETTLLASRNSLLADFEYVVDSIVQGKIDTDKLATHRTTLSNAPNDIKTWAKDRDKVIKALIEIA